MKKSRKELIADIFDECITELWYKRHQLDEYYYACLYEDEEQANEYFEQASACTDAISVLRSLIRLIEKD